MQSIYFEEIFAGSSDTFKAFDHLSFAQAGEKPEGAPATIWQILHHLIAWQYNKLELLKGNQPAHIEEQQTWIEEHRPHSQQEFGAAVHLFYELLAGVETEMKSLNVNAADITAKLKIIQELSTHLSFHLGEVVLMRRMAGNYPIPGNMKAFLN